MKKVIIPRKDHEVYFLAKPQDIKNNKQLQQYVNTQMEKLHPSFSSKTQIDIKQIMLNNTIWLMITVMEEEVLAEYRILHNPARFFTNTSILAAKKDFTDNRIRTIDDEKIGFDAEKNIPVSIPLEIKPDSNFQILAKKTGEIPARYSVFRKTMPPWCLPAISSALFAALLLVVIILISGNGKVKTAEVFSEESQQKPETIKSAIPSRTIPPLIEILASMAIDIVNSGGRVVHWQNKIGSQPFMLIQLQGINLVNVYRIFNSYHFAILEDIQEIRYGDNEPFITVLINLNTDEYKAVPVKEFPINGFTFPMISSLSNSLSNIDIIVNFETLPAAGNNYLEYTISYQSVGWNLIRSLEIILSFCGQYALYVKNLDIQITGSSLFTISCTLSHCDTEYAKTTVMGNEKYYIPIAFGFDEELIESREEPVNIPVIGSIRDSDGRITFYRNTTDGKIQVRVENE